MAIDVVDDGEDVNRHDLVVRDGIEEAKGSSADCVIGNGSGAVCVDVIYDRNNIWWRLRVRVKCHTDGAHQRARNARSVYASRVSAGRYQGLPARCDPSP